MEPARLQLGGGRHSAAGLGLGFGGVVGPAIRFGTGHLPQVDDNLWYASESDNAPVSVNGFGGADAALGGQVNGSGPRDIPGDSSGGCGILGPGAGGGGFVSGTGLPEPFNKGLQGGVSSLPSLGSIIQRGLNAIQRGLDRLLFPPDGPRV